MSCGTPPLFCVQNPKRLGFCSVAIVQTAISQTGAKVKILDILLTKAVAKITKAGIRSAILETGVMALVSTGVIDIPDRRLAHYNSYPTLGELVRTLGGSI